MRAVSRCLLIALMLVFSISAVAQNSSSTATPAAKTPVATPQIKTFPRLTRTRRSGRQMFDAYCASCHGQNGKGNGPAAPALKSHPPTSRYCRLNNGGKFPETHVVLAIKGDSRSTSHGDKDMPVWGPAFLSLGQMDEKIVQLRIANLTTYIEVCSRSNVARRSAEASNSGGFPGTRKRAHSLRPSLEYLR